MTGVQTCALPICFPVTIKVAVKNHSEAVLSDIENAITYLVEQGFTEDEVQEVLTAIESSQAVAIPTPTEKPKAKVNMGGNVEYEVWQLDQMTNERLKVIKTVKAQPHFVELLNEQKFNTKVEYVEK